MFVDYLFVVTLCLLMAGVMVSREHVKLEGRNSALLKWFAQEQVKEVRAFEPTKFLNGLTVSGAFLFVSVPLALAVIASWKAPIIYVGYLLLMVAAAVSTDRKKTHLGPTERYRGLVGPVPATDETQQWQLILSIACFGVGTIVVIYGVITGEEEWFWALAKSAGAGIVGFLLFFLFIPSLRLLRWASEKPILRWAIRPLLKPVWSPEEKRRRLTRALEDRRQHGIGG
jgi:hypothetical protein